MGCSESICFSAVPAEELNKKAFLLRPSLFLFAYYEPKPFSEKESSRSNFKTAIINLYGLFWDCGPFVFNLFRSQNSILLKKWSRWSWISFNANNLRSALSSFRTIFCHNCSSQFPLNEQKIQDAIFWSSHYTHAWQSINELSEDDWKKLLDGLTSEADSLIQDISTALDELSITPDANRRENAIDWWIKQIAVSYQRNPEYLLNAMAGMYQLYLVNSNGTLDPTRDLRFLTIRWIVATFNVPSRKWYEKWLEQTVEDIADTSLFAILNDWQNKWAVWTGASPNDCDEAPMPSSVFFRILANDVDQYARNPNLQKVT